MRVPIRSGGESQAPSRGSVALLTRAFLHRQS